jgi:hypothetical protein
MMYLDWDEALKNQTSKHSCFVIANDGLIYLKWI